MGEIKNFDEKIEMIKEELETRYKKVIYLESKEKPFPHHIYNCDGKSIKVDIFKRVFELIDDKWKMLGIQINV